MKVPVSILVALALLAAPLQAPAPTGPTDEPKLSLLECTMALLVLGVGTVCIIGMVKVCKKLPPLDTNLPPVYPPPPPPKTNSIPTNAIPPKCKSTVYPKAAGYANTVALQVQSPAGWQTAYSFTIVQDGSDLRVVASKDGVAVATNSAPIQIAGGEAVAVLDFSALAITNQGTFYRIAAP